MKDKTPTTITLPSWVSNELTKIQDSLNIKEGDIRKVNKAETLYRLIEFYNQKNN